MEKDLQFVCWTRIHKGKSALQVPLLCSQCKNRKILQIAPSNTGADSYNKRSQSRLGAASA